MKLVLILNLPFVINKNFNQALALKQYQFLFITKMVKGNQNNLPINLIQKPIKSTLLRLLYLIFILIFKKNIINHAEIYPGGRLSILFVILVKLFRVKAVVAERGDIGCIDNYPKTMQWAMEMSYKHADIVWFREPFMKQELEKRGVKHLFFQGNAIFMPKYEKGKAIKEFDFLWVNRLIPDRNISWFIHILNTTNFNHVKSAVLGIQLDTNDNYVKKEQEFLILNQPKNLVTKTFEDPSEFYKSSKFFIFPAKKTYANFSLLESMSYGVVPIISDVPGTEKIIQDGKNGIVCELSKDGLEKCMKRAMALSNSDYERLSENARKTIEDKFSLRLYSSNMTKFYIDLTK